MPTSVRMPQLGESVTEGTIGRWLKKAGDRVEMYEPLVEIITDKVNAEIPSPVAGVVQAITAAEGTTVPVGHEIALVEEVAREGPAAGPPGEPAPVAAGVQAAAAAEEGAGGRRRVTPLVRKLAEERGVDLDRLEGSGPGGRITREDVLNAAARGGAVAAPPAAAAALAGPPAAPAPAPAAPARAAAGAEEEAIAVGPIRRAIAEHMVRSRRTSPHVWTMIEVDVSRLARYREAIKEDFKRREATDLTYLPFVVKAVVESLKEYPLLNASWAEDKILVKKRVHIGVAVALDDGLIVPVIRDADGKSIAALAHAVADLAGRARAGKLKLEDVQGGTFTVNNTGAFGSILSAPIINQPQAAILTMEAIVKRPVVVDDAIAIRSMMNVCLSFDHRILDGAIAGRFLQAVKRRLEGYGPQTPIY